jgi:putative transcriptional regulator
MDQKKTLTTQTFEFLEREQFSVSMMEARKSCFDIIARRGSFILMLKFLLNIDGLSEERAGDLKHLSSLFSAYPLLIGRKTRHFKMDDGVLYGRYGLNAVTIRTFEDVISQDQYPVVISSRGGYYVKLDRERLKRARMEQNVSVGELAEQVGVSRTMIYGYEHSSQGATLWTVLKLEEYLQEDLAAPVEVFTISIPEQRAVDTMTHQRQIFSRLEEIGFEIHPIRKAPFDAVTKNQDEFMLTKVDRKPKRTLKEIRIIKDVSDVASCTAFVVTDSSDAKESVDGIPIVKSSELNRMESSSEFLETLEHRR